MDIQRKKGVLDVCVLAVLKRGPSYGYRIVSDVSACIQISESTLYPILRRLESNGCVSTYRKAYNGRTRKYYQIEQPGLDRVQAFLDEADEMKQIYAFVEGANHD
ncbi:MULTISPECIES: PadR family transcriptional regulator [Caproicibacterium]|jgi:PadR family transcriptional regulator PadR|uniref:PadR family transcriptional regulator n=1 Tax=Caproicibacterium lactatifermentans TaxID=2666138 RepID=A0A859DMX6_9FIRM|nr:PadR family transcriptional regulator [Caproicibacterium lactatifermentans]ARP50914.1 PadR family transcriptional regulator [Ruminococcaceae bacterium CPB6]MDD4808273.1 PadR family transcriptional regulator [Oscillospiraceae bacterium]QKN23357.1 PadR family transcriptional regulator [Caproicibacterium lactatifermentans]QKO29963.1 PadR family transcriptional regulator [Caproicibacterium lactatifermentans]